MTLTQRTVLLITRKHPPSIGGMENLSYNLIHTLGKRIPISVIKWSGKPIWILPIFYVYAFVAALVVGLVRPVALIHVGDPVLAPMGLLLRFLLRTPVVITAHGLDVVYPNPLYQTLISACLRHLDFVVAISEHTRQACLKRGIPEERTCVIPVGIVPSHFILSLPPSERQAWFKKWGVDGGESVKVLVTVGRLFPRKGVHYFVSNVLPRLAQKRQDWVYLIVGDGPDRAAIQQAVEATHLHSRVLLLGQVPQPELQALYALADLFVMPNRAVEGTSEGFGIVSLEARASGVRVVATAIEGIVDAFVPGDDALLVPADDLDALLNALELGMDGDLTLQSRQRRRQLVIRDFAWTRVADQYLEVFRRLGFGWPNVSSPGALHDSRGGDV